MAEFGHFAVHGSTVMIDAWGAGPFIIKTADREFRFEDSDRFGPLLVLRNGASAKQQLGEKSPFWRPYHLWRRQGRRVADDGMTCVWDAVSLTSLVVRHEDGKNLLVVGGKYEEGGGYIVQHCLKRAAGQKCPLCDSLPTRPRE